MKSPQFPTWSSETETTTGGSVYSVAGANGVMPMALPRRVETVRLAGSGVRANGVMASQSADEADALPVPGWKRVFDYVLIALSAPVTLPLGLVIAGWIKLVSPGRVFFKQERVGLGGRPFTILKFRSMADGAPTQVHEEYLTSLIKTGAPMAKLDGEADPRIIPGGRCLRAMGLDELPQLINVLRGEMSLVGPRPSTPKEFALYTPEQRERAGVLPGLTGYWQVSGKNKLTFQQMISLDLHYIKKLSLGLDLAIVVATIPAMLLQFMESRVSDRRPGQAPDQSTNQLANQLANQPAQRAC
ncbi:MAG: sugar transferase [Verrucomicrobiales bacterium]